MEIPFVDTAAAGRNIDRLRIAAGMTVKDMQMVFGFATPQASRDKGLSFAEDFLCWCTNVTIRKELDNLC